MNSFCIAGKFNCIQWINKFQVCITLVFVITVQPSLNLEIQTPKKTDLHEKRKKNILYEQLWIKL